VRKLERLLGEVSAKPANVRFRRLTKLMELAGFRMKFGKTNPGMVIFFHPACHVLPMARKPWRFAYVESSYVQECLNAVEAITIREEHPDG